MMNRGDMEVNAMDKDKALAYNKALNIVPKVFEIVDGKPVVRRIDYKTLTSPDQPTAALKKTSFSGTASGGVKFTADIIVEGDKISCSGKILEKGKVTNPVQFGYTIVVPAMYKYTDEKKLEKVSQDDVIETLNAAGKKKKYKVLVANDYKLPDFATLKATKIEMEPLKGNKYLISASGTTTFSMDKAEGNMRLADGFTLTWMAPENVQDTAKERITVELK